MINYKLSCLRQLEICLWWNLQRITQGGNSSDLTYLRRAAPYWLQNWKRWTAFNRTHALCSFTTQRMNLSVPRFRINHIRFLFILLPWFSIHSSLPNQSILHPWGVSQRNTTTRQFARTPLKLYIWVVLQTNTFIFNQLGSICPLILPSFIIELIIHFAHSALKL